MANKGQFVKGRVPWNKGMKGYAPGGRASETYFKKGSKPHNCLPVGSTRLEKDGYIGIKVEEGKNKWRPLHHEVWKRYHGVYPAAGMALLFIDGDKQNCAIENLKLVSRRELMDRNTLHNLPEELRQVIQLRGVLRRKINGK